MIPSLFGCIVFFPSLLIILGIRECDLGLECCQNQGRFLLITVSEGLPELIRFIIPLVSISFLSVFLELLSYVSLNTGHKMTILKWSPCFHVLGRIAN